MKYLIFGTMILVGGSLLTAQAGPTDDVTGAIQKLAGEANYSWHAAVVVPAESRFKPGPMDGETQQDGLTYLKVNMRDNTYPLFIKGSTVLVDDPDPDGGWQTLADFQSSDNEGPGRFLGYLTRNFKLPAAQARDLAGDCQDLAQTNGAYAGELTPDSVSKLLRFRGNDTVNNPSGSARFWINNGELSKYEFHVKGTITFNDRDVTIDRDTTVEIKDVGTTKITVPNDAKKLLP